MGGAEKVFVSLANKFARSGLNVDLVVVRRSGPLVAELDCKIRVTYLSGGREIWSRFPAICRYLASAQPEVVLSAFVQVNVMVVLARRITWARCRVVISEHSMFSVSHGSNNRVSRRQRLFPCLARFAYPLADEIVAVSDGVADDLADVTGLARDRITVVYNPVEQTHVRRREASGRGENKTATARLVCCGRLEPAKDFPTLIYSLQRLSKSRAVHVDLLGDGSQEEALKMLAKQLGVDELITFHGYVADPFEFYQCADVFVLSSAWEGFGNVLVEAMACGLPVVSTNCPSGPAEILANGAYGPLVPPGNAIALAEAIASVLDNPVDTDALIRRAAEFLPENAAAQYRRILGI